MAEPYLSEIKLVSFNFAPKGWAFCNGQVMSISQNQALFALLGTTYGGNGTTNFNLPDLRGRIAMHTSGGLVLGQPGGEQSHTLLSTEMPGHTHALEGGTGSAGPASTGNVPGPTSQSFYSSGATTTLAPASVANAGSGQLHDNMSPYLVLNYIIALQGIFPSRN